MRFKSSHAANFAMNSKMMERVGTVPTIARESSRHRTISVMKREYDKIDRFLITALGVTLIAIIFVIINLISNNS